MNEYSIRREMWRLERRELQQFGKVLSTAQERRAYVLKCLTKKN